MKTCTKCRQELDESKFSRNRNKKDGLQSWCKECKAAKHQERKEHNLARVLSRRRALAQWLRDYKSTHPCERCGEDHPACLQFHHNDPNEKELELSIAVHRGWSISHLEEEIAKCTVLCANCHCKEHFATLV